jgi:hypothetical protein
MQRHRLTNLRQLEQRAHGHLNLIGNTPNLYLNFGWLFLY